MDLYGKATEFLKMKKHICGENYFNMDIKVTVILASDDRTFISMASGIDLSEYNAFIAMKVSGSSYIKKIICVDEYECVFLPSLRFMEHIVNDNENNSDAFIFTDPVHVRALYSFINNLPNINVFKIPSYFSDKTDDLWNKLTDKNNTIELSENNTPVVNYADIGSADSLASDFEENFQNQNIPDVPVIHTENKNFVEIDSADSLASDFEGVSDKIEKPVVVMKKENMLFENAADEQFEIKGMGIKYQNSINSINAEENIISENYTKLEAGDHDLRPSKSFASVLEAKRLAKLAKKNAKKNARNLHNNKS